MYPELLIQIESSLKEDNLKGKKVPNLLILTRKSNSKENLYCFDRVSMDTKISNFSSIYRILNHSLLTYERKDSPNYDYIKNCTHLYKDFNSCSSVSCYFRIKNIYYSLNQIINSTLFKNSSIRKKDEKIRQHLYKQCEYFFQNLSIKAPYTKYRDLNFSFNNFNTNKQLYINFRKFEKKQFFFGSNDFPKKYLIDFMRSRFNSNRNSSLNYNNCISKKHGEIYAAENITRIIQEKLTKKQIQNKVIDSKTGYIFDGIIESRIDDSIKRFIFLFLTFIDQF